MESLIQFQKEQKTLFHAFCSRELRVRQTIQNKDVTFYLFTLHRPFAKQHIKMAVFFVNKGALFLWNMDLDQDQ